MTVKEVTSDKQHGEEYFFIHSTKIYVSGILLGGRQKMVNKTDPMMFTRMTLHSPSTRQIIINGLYFVRQGGIYVMVLKSI